MKAGNINYQVKTDLPSQAPVFPLSRALLLPGGQLPLNIFEPRYLEMFDDAIRGDRVIAMIQPLGEPTPQEEIVATDPQLYDIGCLGRITAYQESGDGSLLVNLSGICRFKIAGRVQSEKSYTIHEIDCYDDDLVEKDENATIDRDRLLKTFRDYLEANQMDADWQSVEETETDQLVNALCMMSPYGPAEKQAMLEADNIAHRAEKLIAITEFELAKIEGSEGGSLQ